MTLLAELESHLESDLLITGSDADRYAFNGFKPEAIVRPADAEHAAQTVRTAAEAGACVVPCGGVTKLARYPLPTRPAVMLTTERMTDVLDYAPRDMTVTVRSGIRLADLNETLAKEGQRLPLDPPHAAATIGGILAANDSGPIRLSNGTARDLVIGMQMVLADGHVIKSGGKVVKNVAGYDLHKLFIGSAGTLGLITTVTFKLRPIPEVCRLVVLRPPDWSTAADWVVQLNRGPTRPALIELLNPPLVARHLDADGDVGIALVVGYEDMRKTVDWQCDQLDEAFNPAPIRYDEDASRSLYERLRDWPAETGAVAFKARMTATHVTRFAEQATEHGWSLLARAASGIVYATTDEPHLADRLDELDRLARDAGGSLTVLRGPARPTHFGWHHRADADLIMRRIKDQFDPDRVFGDGPHVVAAAAGE